MTTPLSYNSRKMPAATDLAHTATDSAQSNSFNSAASYMRTTSSTTISLYDETTDDYSSSSSSESEDEAASQSRHIRSTAHNASSLVKDKDNQRDGVENVQTAASLSLESFHTTAQDILDGTAFEDALELSRDARDSATFEKSMVTRHPLKDMHNTSSSRFEGSPRRLQMVTEGTDARHVSGTQATLCSSSKHALSAATEPCRSPFSLTDLADLDIESILDAYADWDAVAMEAALFNIPSSQPPSTPAPLAPQVPVIATSKPSRPAKSSARSTRNEALSPLVYRELFPPRSVAPFPTVPRRRKSGASLAPSEWDRECRDVVPPLPTVPPHFASGSVPYTSQASLFPVVQSLARRPSDGASFVSSSSSARSRAANRSSVASSSAGSSSSTASFRWSTYSGSTAASTIAESDEGHGASGHTDSPALGSGYKMFATPSSLGTGTARKTPKHVKRQSEMMDWTTFAHELLEEEEHEAEALVITAPSLESVRTRPVKVTPPAASARPAFSSISRSVASAADASPAEENQAGYIHFDRDLQTRKSGSGSIRSARSARSARSTESATSASRQSTTTSETPASLFSSQQRDAMAKSSARMGVPSFFPPPPPVPTATPTAPGVRFAPSAALRAMRSSPNLKSSGRVSAPKKHEALNRGLARVMLG